MVHFCNPCAWLYQADGLDRFQWFYQAHGWEGSAISDLMPLTVNFDGYNPSDDLGALDDFRKGGPSNI